MPRGFASNDGWFGLVWRLCEDLEPLVAEFEQASGTQFEILQVKEKFGELRIYVNDANEPIRARLLAAQLESIRISEICGQPGQLREGS